MGLGSDYHNASDFGTEYVSDCLMNSMYSFSRFHTFLRSICLYTSISFQNVGVMNDRTELTTVGSTNQYPRNFKKPPPEFVSIYHRVFINFVLVINIVPRVMTKTKFWKKANFLCRVMRWLILECSEAKKGSCRKMLSKSRLRFRPVCRIFYLRKSGIGY